MNIYTACKLIINPYTAYFQHLSRRLADGLQHNPGWRGLWRLERRRSLLEEESVPPPSPRESCSTVTTAIPLLP